MANENLGNRLREERKRKDLTLKEVGHRTGFTDSYISMLENGKIENTPKPETIKRLSVGLNVPFMELMNEAGYHDYKYETLSETFGFDVMKRNKTEDLYIKLKNNDDIFYNGYELSKDDKYLMYDLFERLFSMPNRRELYKEDD